MNTLGIIERNYYSLEREYKKAENVFQRGCSVPPGTGHFRSCCGAQNFSAASRRIYFFASGGPISFNSERNGGKNAGKNCVFAFPHALCRVKKRECLPHVRGSFPVSFRQRTVSATAPLPLAGSTNNAFGSTVAAHERQRRKREVSSSYGTAWNLFCERVGKGINNK